jgi:hypothetical protein
MLTDCLSISLLVYNDWMQYLRRDSENSPDEMTELLKSQVEHVLEVFQSNDHE